MQASHVLLQPFRLGRLELRNRILSTSHAPAYGDDGMPGERYQLYHEEKARGGIALTMFGGSASVAVDSPASPWKQLDVSSDAIVPRFREFADRIHRHGAALMCQLTHMGRRTRWDVDRWIVPISSSPVPEPAHGSFPKEMEDSDIRRVQQSYAAAARRCKEGGLDGCEILVSSHLIFQFLSPRVNRRTDAYGGGAEGRLRFAVEVLEQVREAVGPDFPVGARMTGDELAEGGLGAAECLEIFERLAATGLVDFLSVIGAEVFTHMEMANYMPNMAYPGSPYLHLASALKQRTELPVFHAGRIHTLEEAATAIAEGHVDMVGMTRAHIADPHLVRKLADGRPDEIRPCVGANYCIDRIYMGQDALCLHNAATGREARLPHRVPIASQRKKVVIVGAGPGGLEAARVCAERGHAVVLFERQDRPGGQLNLAVRAGWRKGLAGIVGWLETQVRKRGVDLRLGCEADAAAVRAEAPDEVVVATGGRPNLDVAPGSELAISGWDLLSGAQAPPESALVYDAHGEHQAASVAEFLAAAGTRVELVTPSRAVAQALGATNFSIHLRELYRLGVRLTPDHRIARLEREDGRVAALLRNEYSGGEERRVVDSVVIEYGTLPVAELYFALKPESTNLGEIDWDALVDRRPQTLCAHPDGAFRLFRIGDALAGRNVHAAIHDALRLCVDL